MIGLAMLALWAVVWRTSTRRDHLVGGQRSWVPAYHYLGIDFLNNYLASRHWLSGGNPYTESIGDPREGTPLGGQFIYPPTLLPVFAWCQLVSFKVATRIWIVALALMAGIGAMVAWRCRKQLGLTDVPWPFALAAILCSTPVIFAMERGNCDLLVLLPIAGAAWALQRRSVGADFLAGGCLALAAWIKLYPAVLVLCLPALRRPRALVAFAVINLAILVPSLPYVGPLLANQRIVTTTQKPTIFYPSVHTLSAYWDITWPGTPLAWLGRFPGTAIAATFILTLALWMTWQLRRCPDGERLAYPYLLWLAALATFLPPISNDYNFFYLPLAALALWDRRDPVLVHVLMAFLLLWWQPAMLSIGPKLLFAFKMAGFLGVTMSFVQRMRELGNASVQAPPAVQRTLAPAA